MTVTELRKKAEELESKEMGDAKVILLEHWDKSNPPEFGIFGEDEFEDFTIFGNKFPKNGRYVYLDIDN